MDESAAVAAMTVAGEPCVGTHGRRGPPPATAACFTTGAVDEDGGPVDVPAVVPETDRGERLVDNAPCWLRPAPRRRQPFHLPASALPTSGSRREILCRVASRSGPRRLRVGVIGVR